MTIRPFGLAISAALLGLGLLAGGAQAQSSMEPMKKPDAMKMNSMKTDNMSTNSMKANDMKMGGTKADCLHKAGMEKDAMKKSDMMSHCDAMK